MPKSCFNERLHRLVFHGEEQNAIEQRSREVKGVR